MAHSLASKHIIIAGAGISGLSFARALDRSWPDGCAKPSITMYERSDASSNAKGYTLGLHSESGAGGLQALQTLDLIDDIFEDSITRHHTRDLVFRFWDASWNPILSLTQKGKPLEGVPVARMRVARRSLCRHLLDGVPSNVKIHYGTLCTTASPTEKDRVSVLLNDGSSVECDLLVVADGANSKIRTSLRPADGLSFAGPILISGTAKFPASLPNWIEDKFGMVLGGNGTSLFISPIDAHSVHWGLSYLSKSMREPIQAPEAARLSTELLTEAKKRGSHLGQHFQQIVDATDMGTLTVFNAQDKQPIEHEDIAKAPIVYIGDSNHAMSPFSGNGANMALMDAVQLAEEIAGSSTVSKAIKAFDQRTMPRCSKAVNESHWFIAAVHSSGWRYIFWKFLMRILSFIIR